MKKTFIFAMASSISQKIHSLLRAAMNIQQHLWSLERVLTDPICRSLPDLLKWWVMHHPTFESPGDNHSLHHPLCQGHLISFSTMVVLFYVLWVMPFFVMPVEDCNLHSETITKWWVIMNVPRQLQAVLMVYPQGRFWAPLLRINRAMTWD